MSDLEAFRREVRAWIEEHCPPVMRTPSLREDDEEVWGGRKEVIHDPDARLWLERMVDKRWIAPAWPREYGGAGLSEAEARIVEEEQRRLGCRHPLRSFGLWMLGPVLLEYGSEEQRREHLPGIARGKIRWCQGYSEPNAGSDLASLQTRAVRHGDEYVVTGQKTWTSHADRADWMFLLVRTDAGAPKREGISFLLVDMESPGISARPIRLISGASPFCETFFDEVRVPVRNRVGPENGGWNIAKALLRHERAAISRMRGDRNAEEEPIEALARRCLGGDAGPLPDPVLRDRVAQHNLDTLANRLTLRRSVELAAAGGDLGPVSSVLKLYGMELNKRRRELKVALLGYQGLGWEGEGFDEDELRATHQWLRSRANSIEGGTSEIQLNIIARRILGLPSGEKE
jgi:acyl-CoA dehydrogenase